MKLAKAKKRSGGYEDTFYTLAGLGVYGDVFAKKLPQAPVCRNRLVHEYNDTKREIVLSRSLKRLRFTMIIADIF